MNFYRHHWYYVGIYLFVALAYWIAIWGSEIGQIQLILLYSFMALLVHQFEEYAIPGGFPAIFNLALFREEAAPDRYPLNANQVLMTNVIIGYPFYILPIFFPQLIWLGLAQILFGVIQLIFHGIVVNLRLKTLYNPGLAATLLLHIPIGIYYIWYANSQNLLTVGNVIGGIIGTIIAGLITIALPIRLMSSRTSPYPFLSREMQGYASEKIEKLRLTQ